MNDILTVKNLTKTYQLGKHSVFALRGINFAIPSGETFGIIGESGCGKSTLGKLALKLESPSTGEIYFKNTPIHNLSNKQMHPLRCHMQIIFQDSYASLNPRMTIADIVEEGLVIHQSISRLERQEKAAEMLAQVGIPTSYLKRYPHELSGGQRQRINIARALMLNPEFLVCDEPVSALDAQVQSQVMDLLTSLKKQRKLTYLFISHDLHVIKQIADTVAVMYLGQIVEQAPVDQLFNNPKHPYTQTLLSAAFHENVKHTLPIQGEPPSAIHIPSGCPFHSRCPKATSACRQLVPELKSVAKDHIVACHLV